MAKILFTPSFIKGDILKVNPTDQDNLEVHVNTAKDMKLILKFY